MRSIVSLVGEAEFTPLFVLTGILAGVAWLRLQQGFLTVDSALARLRYIVRFAVLPGLFFALLWRWTGRRGAGDA